MNEIQQIKSNLLVSKDILPLKEPGIGEMWRGRDQIPVEFNVKWTERGVIYPVTGFLFYY